MRAWVDAKERLPDTTDTYLVIFVERKLRIVGSWMPAQWDREAGKWTDSSRFLCGEVTHWLPGEGS